MKTPRTSTTSTRKGTPGKGTRKDGQGSNWIRRSTRLAIYHRDGHRCVYCGCKVRPGRGTKGQWAATLDHVLAVELGGRNDPSNLVTCCKSCNAAKNSLSVRKFFRTLAAKGTDTTKVAARVRTATSTPLTPELRKLGLADAKAGK